MHYSLSAVLLASALSAVGVPAEAASASQSVALAGPARTVVLAALTARASAAPLMLADSDTGATGSGTYAATPATPATAGEDSATPATPKNPTAYDQTQDHRPQTHDADQTADQDTDTVARPDTDRLATERPEVDRPEVEQPEINRPDVQRPEIQRPDMSH